MKKIPTIFLRREDNRALVSDTPNPDCAWVFKGIGKAHRKLDGTCCLMYCGSLYKRRELSMTASQPPDFIEVELDAITGKRVGWVPVDPNAPEDKWHMEALANSAGRGTLPAGSYELIGPKIQGNAEDCSHHELVKHSGTWAYFDVPRSFNELRDWLAAHDIEGLVFVHPDGHMAKIKKRDFGLPRKPAEAPAP